MPRAPNVSAKVSAWKGTYNSAVTIKQGIWLSALVSTTLGNDDTPLAHVSVDFLLVEELDDFLWRLADFLLSLEGSGSVRLIGVTLSDCTSPFACVMISSSISRSKSIDYFLNCYFATANFVFISWYSVSS